MGYAARAGFGATFWQQAQTLAAQQTAAKTTPAPTAPITTDMPHIAVPPPSIDQPQVIAPPPPTWQPPAVTPILVAGPAPSSSGGGGGGGGGEFGLAPAAGGTSVSGLLQQPAVVVGLLVLGFLALRRGGGTRRF